MIKRRAFASFDVEHDEDLRDRLITQSQQPDLLLDLADWSVREPESVNSREMLRKRIGRLDLMVVICGEHTDTATGVADELAIAISERKPYFLLMGRAKTASKMPKGAKDTDKIYGWTLESLRALIGGVR